MTSHAAVLYRLCNSKKPGAHQCASDDIKGAFNHVRWDGLLEHLWSIGCHGRVFHLFKSLSDQYIRVVTPLDSSDLHPVSAGVPQGPVWSPLLFNLYIRLLPSIPKYCVVVGYADLDHHPSQGQSCHCSCSS